MLIQQTPTFTCGLGALVTTETQLSLQSKAQQSCPAQDGSFSLGHCGSGGVQKQSPS